MGNKFRLGRKIGSGSFGEIYLGELWIAEKDEILMNWDMFFSLFFFGWVL